MANGRLLVGRRYYKFIGCIVAAIGLTLYPIVIHPMIYTDQYKEIQRRNRAGIKQEDVQPGNMKVWTDPFNRK